MTKLGRIAWMVWTGLWLKHLEDEHATKDFEGSWVGILVVALAEFRNRILRRTDELASPDPSDDELAEASIAAFCDVLFDELLDQAEDRHTRRRLESARRKFFGRMLLLARSEPRIVHWQIILTEALCGRRPGSDKPVMFPFAEEMS
jgi:hypothetical protein